MTAGGSVVDAAAISAALAERTAAWDALDATAPGRERMAARQRCRLAAAALDELKRAAQRAFAKPRGWNLSRTKWTMDHPVVDHAEVYLSHRRTVAVLTHSYATREQIEGYAAEHGLAVEYLPWSWYYPGGCIAAVLTPGAIVLAEWKRRHRGLRYRLARELAGRA
jgi:hypothetical protein